MTQQPIPEEFGQSGDTYDDGTVPPLASPIGPPDPTSFEHSDIAINTTLFSEDGDPQGRLVSIVVHNFADLRVTRDYRAATLTQQSLLDNLQHGINETVQDFLFHQAEARKKRLGVQEKTKTRPSAPAVMPTVAAPTTPAPSTPRKDTTPAPKKEATPAPKKDAAKAAATDQFQLF